MLVDRRDAGRWIRGGLGRLVGLALLLPVLSACTAVAGGGVAVVVIAIGALTSHCYDYLDVTVFDAHGRKTCAATVTATKGSEHFELQSCYYAPLTDGRWTLRAAQPGSVDAVTTVQVEHANDCTRHVQSVELSLTDANAPRSPNALPGAGISPAIAAPAAPPAVAPSSPPAAAVPSPPTPASSSSAPPATSAAPGASVTPSVGVFPN